jgi:hypothetical protein
MITLKYLILLLRLVRARGMRLLSILVGFHNSTFFSRTRLTRAEENSLMTLGKTQESGNGKDKPLVIKLKRKRAQHQTSDEEKNSDEAPSSSNTHRRKSLRQRKGSELVERKNGSIVTSNRGGESKSRHHECGESDGTEASSEEDETSEFSSAPASENDDEVDSESGSSMKNDGKHVKRKSSRVSVSRGNSKNDKTRRSDSEDTDVVPPRGKDKRSLKPPSQVSSRYFSKKHSPAPSVSSDESSVSEKRSSNRSSKNLTRYSLRNQQPASSDRSAVVRKSKRSRNKIKSYNESSHSDREAALSEEGNSEEEETKPVSRSGRVVKPPPNLGDIYAKEKEEKLSLKQAKLSKEKSISEYIKGSKDVSASSAGKRIDPDVKKVLLQILDYATILDEEYKFFSDPVDPDVVLGYYDIISNPMDLSTIR